MSLIGKLFGKKSREEVEEITAEAPQPKQPEEIPVFNLYVKDEHVVSKEIRENPDWNSLLGDCFVTSLGGLKKGRVPGLKTYEADLERYITGRPANLHFNCGGDAPLDSNYPFRVFQDGNGYHLTLISLGTDPVRFEGGPRFENSV